MGEEGGREPSTFSDLGSLLHLCYMIYILYKRDGASESVYMIGSRKLINFYSKYCLTSESAQSCGQILDTWVSFTQGNLLLRKNNTFFSGEKKTFSIVEQEVSFITLIKRTKIY